MFMSCRFHGRCGWFGLELKLGKAFRSDRAMQTQIKLFFMSKHLGVIPGGESGAERADIRRGSVRFEVLHPFVSVQRSHKDHKARVCLRLFHDSLLSGMSCVYVPVNGGDCSAVQAPMTVPFRHSGTSSVDR